jgi:hypothetical protein
MLSEIADASDIVSLLPLLPSIESAAASESDSVTSLALPLVMTSDGVMLSEIGLA